MTPKILGYRLQPIYENNELGTVSTCCMMICMYTGETLSHRSGGPDIISPSVYEKLRNKEMLYPPS